MRKIFFLISSLLFISFTVLNAASEDFDSEMLVDVDEELDSGHASIVPWLRKSPRVKKSIERFSFHQPARKSSVRDQVRIGPKYQASFPDASDDLPLYGETSRVSTRVKIFEVNSGTKKVFVSVFALDEKDDALLDREDFSLEKAQAENLVFGIIPPSQDVISRADLYEDLSFGVSHIKAEENLEEDAAIGGCDELSDDIAELLSNTSNQEPVYYVERIVNVKIQGGLPLYEVKWQGYTSKDNTWEPSGHLSKEVRRVFLLGYCMKNKGRKSLKLKKLQHELASLSES